DSGSTDPSTSCIESFSVAFEAPPSSGDCKVTIIPSTYGEPTAVYYFAAPTDVEKSVACERLEGPLLGRCMRTLGVIALGTTSADDMKQLRADLGVTGSSFHAAIQCARAIANPNKTVT